MCKLATSVGKVEQVPIPDGAADVKSKPSKHASSSFLKAIKVATVPFEIVTVGKFEVAVTERVEPDPEILSTTYLPLTPSIKKISPGDGLLVKPVKLIISVDPLKL